MGAGPRGGGGEDVSEQRQYRSGEVRGSGSALDRTLGRIVSEMTLEAEQPQNSLPARLCVVCDGSFHPKTANALTCGFDCREELNRRAAWKRKQRMKNSGNA